MQENITIENSEAKEEMSFEQKVNKAKQLLNDLTDPEITLSNSVKIYKEGLKEIDDAQKMLDAAKLNFETLNKQ